MKNILITGSSRGIGRAIAEQAYIDGYRVIVHGKTDSNELQSINNNLRGSIKTVFDISDKQATRNAIMGLTEKIGAIDALVNNAGIARNFLKDVSDLDDEKAIEEYKTNVLGTLHCIQAVLPTMVKQKSGSIVNIASIKGHYNLATTSTLTFATTKSGIISITKALAKTYGANGIRINSVSPGYVETDQVKDWDADTFNRIDEGTILERIGQPHEIAPLVMFLISDAASYITGSDFLADGGYAIKGK